VEQTTLNSTSVIFSRLTSLSRLLRATVRLSTVCRRPDMTVDSGSQATSAQASHESDSIGHTHTRHGTARAPHPRGRATGRAGRWKLNLSLNICICRRCVRGRVERHGARSVHGHCGDKPQARAARSASRSSPALGLSNRCDSSASDQPERDDEPHSPVAHCLPLWRGWRNHRRQSTL
jgi:hypothetical protein